LENLSYLFSDQKQYNSAVKRSLEELELRERDQFRTHSPEEYIDRSNATVDLLNNRLGKFEDALRLARKTEKFASQRQIGNLSGIKVKSINLGNHH
jgi:vacuolar-type H+-ATPase subunit I/STV1